MLIALFVANPWKLFECLLSYEWIQSSVAVKWNFTWQESNEVLIHAAKWMHLKYCIVNPVTNQQK